MLSYFSDRNQQADVIPNMAKTAPKVVLYVSYRVTSESDSDSVI